MAFVVAATVFGRIGLILVPVLLVAVLGFWVASVLRRKAQEPTRHSVGAGFTLEELRRMRDAGEINEAEYERARAKMVDQVREGDEREREEIEEKARRAGLETPPRPRAVEAKDMDLLEKP